jgi:hypothetical protein
MENPGFLEAPFVTACRDSRHIRTIPVNSAQGSAKSFRRNALPAIGLPDSDFGTLVRTHRIDL